MLIYPRMPRTQKFKWNHVRTTNKHSLIGGVSCWPWLKVPRWVLPSSPLRRYVQLRVGWGTSRGQDHTHLGDSPVGPARATISYPKSRASWGIIQGFKIVNPTWLGHKSAASVAEAGVWRCRWQAAASAALLSTGTERHACLPTTAAICGGLFAMKTRGAQRPRTATTADHLKQQIYAFMTCFRSCINLW